MKTQFVDCVRARIRNCRQFRNTAKKPALEERTRENGGTAAAAVARTVCTRCERENGSEPPEQTARNMMVNRTEGGSEWVTNEEKETRVHVQNQSRVDYGEGHRQNQNYVRNKITVIVFLLAFLLVKIIGIVHLCVASGFAGV